jgi:hypothetical protein
MFVLCVFIRVLYSKRGPGLISMHAVRARGDLLRVGFRSIPSVFEHTIITTTSDIIPLVTRIATSLTPVRYVYEIGSKLITFLCSSPGAGGSCAWSGLTVVEGHVFDIAAFLPLHPGGKLIQVSCSARRVRLCVWACLWVCWLVAV